MKHKVFNKSTHLITQGTTEEIVRWLLRNDTDGCYVRNGATGELQSPSEFLSLYV